MERRHLAGKKRMANERRTFSEKDVGHHAWSRGYLPHIEFGESTYFLSFRTADSLPAQVIERLKATMLREDNELATRYRYYRAAEACLDRGLGACPFRNAECAEKVSSALRHFDGQRYDLYAWTIMPNHVHVVFSLRPGNELSQVLHSWKSYTSTVICKEFGITAPLWQREYFDRIIRSRKHFESTIRYVAMNPIRSGLEGWRFVEPKVLG